MALKFKDVFSFFCDIYLYFISLQHSILPVVNFLWLVSYYSKILQKGQKTENFIPWPVTY